MCIGGDMKQEPQVEKRQEPQQEKRQDLVQNRNQEVQQREQMVDSGHLSKEDYMMLSRFKQDRERVGKRWPEQIQDKVKEMTSKIEELRLLHDERVKQYFQVSRDKYKFMGSPEYMENDEISQKRVAEMDKAGEDLVDTMRSYIGERQEWRLMQEQGVNEPAYAQDYDVISKEDQESAIPDPLYDILHELNASYRSGGGSDSYCKVRESLNAFLLSSQKPAETLEEAQEHRRNYGRVVSAANKYLNSHSGYRFTSKGKNRVNLINSLKTSLIPFRTNVETQYAHFLQDSAPNYLKNEDTYKRVFETGSIKEQFMAFYQYNMNEAAVAGSLVSEHSGDLQLQMKESMEQHYSKLQRLMNTSEGEHLGSEDKRRKKEAWRLYFYMMVEKRQKLADEQKRYQMQAPKRDDVDPYIYGCLMANNSRAAMEYAAITQMRVKLLSDGLQEFSEKELKLVADDSKYKEARVITQDVLASNSKYIDRIPPDIRMKADKMRESWRDIVPMFMVEEKEKEVPVPVNAGDIGGLFKNLQDFCRDKFETDHLKAVREHMEQFMRERNSEPGSRDEWAREAKRCEDTQAVLDQYLKVCQEETWSDTWTERKNMVEQLRASVTGIKLDLEIMKDRRSQ